MLWLMLYLKKDPESRLAIETFATSNNVIIGGEIRASEISRQNLKILFAKRLKILVTHKGFHLKL